MLNKVLIQNVSSVETRTISQACMLSNGIEVKRADISDLQHMTDDLNGFMPVGSVEFIREFMKISGIIEPENISYPSSIKPMYQRKIEKTTAKEAKLIDGSYFVKPVTTKLFTGFLMCDREFEDQFDIEQFAKYATLPQETEVWISEIVNFVSEYRYYVQDKKIIGMARYDQNEYEDAPVPDAYFVKSVVDSLPFNHPYTVDIGVLDTGESAVVECNDAWAIGLYGKALAPKDYLLFLSNRWQSILDNCQKLC